MKATPERIEKLPAWARLHIQRLQSELRDAEEALKIATNESSDIATGVVTANVGLTERGIRQEIALPDMATISFHFGDGRDRISMHRDPDEMMVKVYAGFGQLFVNPRAANAANLIPECAFGRFKGSD